MKEIFLKLQIPLKVKILIHSKHSRHVVLTYLVFPIDKTT